MTTRLPGLRLRQLPVLAALALLASCGGSPIDAEALGNGIGEAFVCVFANCKPSAEVSPPDITLSYRATHSGNQVTLEAQLNQANRWAVLQLSPGDTLSAELNGRPLELKGPTATWPYHSASAEVPGDLPTVRVSFRRGGQTYVSTVTLPKRFAMLSPGGSAQLNSRSADLDVVLALPGPSKPTLRSDGSCILENGSSSSILDAPPFVLVEAGTSEQRYRLKAAELGRHVETALSTGASKPRSCEFKLSWAMVESASVPDGLSKLGSRSGESAVKLTLSYDATR